MSTTMGMTVGAMAMAAVSLGLCLRGSADAPKVDVPRTEATIGQGETTAEGTVWRGRTTVVLASGATAVVNEEVVLDANEALVRAFTSVEERGARIATWYAPAQGEVITESAEGVAREHVATDGTPWVYGPVRTPGGAVIGTPLGAWATYRAAQHHEQVRQVSAHAAAVVPVDQLVVPTEGAGVAVVLGEDMVDVDGTSVTALHLRAVGSTLVRVARADCAPVRPSSVTARAGGDPAFVHGT